jgi:hypothetical protein
MWLELSGRCCWLSLKLVCLASHIQNWCRQELFTARVTMHFDVGSAILVGRVLAEHSWLWTASSRQDELHAEAEFPLKTALQCGGISGRCTS